MPEARSGDTRAEALEEDKRQEVGKWKPIEIEASDDLLKTHARSDLANRNPCDVGGGAAAAEAGASYLRQSSLRYARDQ